MAHPLVREIRAALQESADPLKAPQMQAYMKSAMPYRGVSSPAQKAIWKRAFSAHALPSAHRWQRVALTLWLLYDCIEPNMADTQFFIRKAIGWALRQHAWTDPREVKRYVPANRSRLSGLSIREALKNIVPA